MEDQLIDKLLWPLFRLLLGLSCGLLLAAILESLHWTRYLGRLTFPLSRLAHLGSSAASAFGLAFVSSAGANALLASKYVEGAISRRELILANLFNSFPAFLLHLPTIFLLLWPVLGTAAIIYVALSSLAALLRAVFTVFLGALLLPRPEKAVSDQDDQPEQSVSQVFFKALQRFRKRLPVLLLFTTPVYIAMYYGQELGFFKSLESWLAMHLDWITFLRPQVMGIIGLQLMAELGATLGAAGAALQDASLTPQEVVVAMLVGNVLSTPIRAIRHQFPAYCGFYRPALAVRLVLANQVLRGFSMVLVLAAYIFCCA